MTSPPRRLGRPPEPGVAGRGAAGADPIRVIVCDDSLIVRKIITRLIEPLSDIHLVATATNGQELIDELDRQSRVDVVILDVQMPVMDGLEALSIIKTRHPKVRVLVNSTLTHAGAEVTIEALTRGAHDYLPKPSGVGTLSREDFGRDLVLKVRALGRGVRRSVRPAAAPPATTATPTPPTPQRRLPSQRPQLIALAASTGGPAALDLVLKQLTGLPIPIIITQHMPAPFTAVFAKHLSQNTGVPVVEAATGDPLTAGQALLAPGGSHLGLVRDGASICARLSQDPPENFCRPAADYMLRDCVSLFGARTLAIVLTGIGQDGRAGCEAVIGAGGAVMAQDEASSVVWGMPGSVVNAGLASRIQDPTSLGRVARQLVLGR